jgi:TonB family protein
MNDWKRTGPAIALLITALAFAACGKDEETPAAAAVAAAASADAAALAAASATEASRPDSSDTSQLIAATREYAASGCSVARRRLERCAACEAPEQKPQRDLLLAYCAEREAPASARELYDAIISNYPSSEASATAIMRVRQIDAAELPALGDYAGPKPAATDRPQPAYPSLAESAGIEGRVRLRFDVRGDGSTENVRVIESSPPLIFDAVALYAISSWKYAAKTPAESQQVVLRFDLPDELAAPETAK